MDNNEIAEISNLLQNDIDNIKLDFKTLDEIDVIYNDETLNLIKVTNYKLLLEHSIRTIVHDIANPITSITVNTDFLLQYIENTDDTVTNVLESNRKQLTILRESFDKVRYQNAVVEAKIDIFQALSYLKSKYKINNQTQFFISNRIFQSSALKIDLVTIFILSKIADLVNFIENQYLNINQDSIQIVVKFKDDSMIENSKKIFDLDSFSLVAFIQSLFTRILPKYDYTFSQNNHEGSIYWLFRVPMS